MVIIRIRIGIKVESEFTAVDDDGAVFSVGAEPNVFPAFHDIMVSVGIDALLTVSHFEVVQNNRYDVFRSPADVSVQQVGDGAVAEQDQTPEGVVSHMDIVDFVPV